MKLERQNRREEGWKTQEVNKSWNKQNKDAKKETNRLVTVAYTKHLKENILDKKGNHKELFKVKNGIPNDPSSTDNC